MTLGVAELGPIAHAANTRNCWLAAMGPALVAVTAYGEEGATRLLIFSRVVLSLQRPFAVYPLVCLTNSPELMGEFIDKPDSPLA
jgi:Mn2+/Fe2+ NRAMP family transporter